MARETTEKVSAFQASTLNLSLVPSGLRFPCRLSHEFVNTLQIPKKVRIGGYSGASYLKNGQNLYVSTDANHASSNSGQLLPSNHRHIVSNYYYL